jgi:uroporphyrin-III C-methyltransferase / precorrin-2 dehydrogenase / sirohydrochlorin ferrochelatase
MLNLRGRRCLLVGAGQVAQRKLLHLLSEDAVMTVVAPTVIEPIARLAAEGKVTLHERPFVGADLDHCQLVFAATGDRAVDQSVAAAARERGIWVNVADVPELCDFQLPAILRRGDLHVAIGSAGGAPFAVRRLRDLLARRIGPEWADWTAAAKRFRQRVHARGASAAVADACYDRFISSTIDEHSLAVRLPTEREEVEWSGLGSEAAASSREEPVLGQVSLVGAGPGHPGLLTVQGMNRLRSADAIVYDRLAIPAIPLDLPDTVEFYSVGKEPDHHPVPQEEINALLSRLARMGKRVVRLKGGDPFVFARGGEEALVLRADGIPYEVIPGVTAGIAVPAAAGIPVTCRGEAVRLTFVTAHEGGSPKVRWDLLAQDTHATLVGYMGVKTLADVSASLMAAGMSGDTPAAVIEQGTLPRQRSVRAPLRELAAAVHKHGIRAPAIFVIGQVVAHAEVLADPAPKPLRHARIGLFAPRSSIADALEAAGAEILVAPCPLTKAARLVLASAPLTGWIVCSLADLDVLDRERAASGLFANCTLYCSDTQWVATARARGWTSEGEIAGKDPAAQIVEAVRRSSSPMP